MSLDIRRIVRGFLIAPLAAPPTYLALIFLVEPFSVQRLLDRLFGALVFGTVLSYLCAILAGVPLFLALHFLGLRGSGWFAALGSGIGATLVAILFSSPTTGWYPPVGYILVCAACGAVSAYLFWHLAVRGPGLGRAGGRTAEEVPPAS
jgi:uncharacterized membrane protein AbrB (regulator of aidB expression)